MQDIFLPLARTPDLVRVLIQCLAIIGTSERGEVRREFNPTVHWMKGVTVMSQTHNILKPVSFSHRATRPSQELDLTNRRLEVGRIRSSASTIYLLYATDVTLGEVTTIRWDEASPK